MSFSPTPKFSTRPNEIILSARQFFALRDSLDRFHESFRDSNSPSFPSFGARFTISGGELMIRASALDTSASISTIREAFDVFYGNPFDSIDSRISPFVEPSSPFGKMSVSLYLALLMDPTSGNLNLLKTLFPSKDLDNPIVRGVSVTPIPSLDDIFQYSQVASSSIASLLELDLVSRLRYLLASLELVTSGLGSDQNLTVPSDSRGSPVELSAGSLVKAISEISPIIRATEGYVVLNSLLCEK